MPAAAAHTIPSSLLSLPTSPWHPRPFPNARNIRLRHLEFQQRRVTHSSPNARRDVTLQVFTVLKVWSLRRQRPWEPNRDKNSQAPPCARWTGNSGWGSVMWVFTSPTPGGSGAWLGCTIVSANPSTAPRALLLGAPPAPTALGTDATLGSYVYRCPEDAAVIVFWKFFSPTRLNCV